MINRSASKLNENEVKKLTDLLIEYQDVFAKDVFDLGNFTEIEHRIDTKDATPIKLRMRRTPACFVDEEKEHLNKMLKAGVSNHRCLSGRQHLSLFERKVAVSAGASIGEN